MNFKKTKFWKKFWYNPHVILTVFEIFADHGIGQSDWEFLNEIPTIILKKIFAHVNQNNSFKDTINAPASLPTSNKRKKENLFYEKSKV